MTGAAYALSLTLPSDGFAVIAGDPAVGGLHGATRHFHCTYCMSWVFTRPQGMDFVNLRATMLDDARWFAPFVEMWSSEKLSFAETGAAHSYTADPPLSDYPALIAAYQTAGVRPV
jgi:hypothetical protein